MRVLRRTDDQVHRQAFHWSREIWGGEGQLALNSYMPYAQWHKSWTHRHVVGLHHHNDQPALTGCGPLADACWQCLCRNIMAQDMTLRVIILDHAVNWKYFLGCKSCQMCLTCSRTHYHACKLSETWMKTNLHCLWINCIRSCTYFVCQ